MLPRYKKGLKSLKSDSFRISNFVKFYFQVHIKDDTTDDWLLLLSIPVKPLSADPDIPENNLLCNLMGIFTIRVAARNLSGLGATSELNVVVNGWLMLYLRIL